MSKKNKHKEENIDKNVNTTTEETKNQEAENQEAENLSTETEKQEEKPVEEKADNALKKAQEELEELKDRYLSTVAEFENFKKRTQKEKAELIFNGGEKTVSAILPVLDDMDRAIQNAAKAEDIKALEKGWELIAKKLMTTLEGLGVKKIDTQDKNFDVDFHEAIAMVPNVEDDKKGKVIDCVQTGYTLNEKVIRHAKVAVGQ